MNERGPDYAHELSPSEQITLNRLLAQVGRRPRRKVAAPVAAGLAAAVILLVTASVLTVSRTLRPPVAAVGAMTSAPELFTELADAAAHAGPSAATVPAPAVTRTVERRLEVSVEQTGGNCVGTAIDVTIRTEPSPAWPEPIAGSASLVWVGLPPTVYRMVGCTLKSYVVKNPAPLADTSSDAMLGRGWATMRNEHPEASVLPPFVDPRTAGNLFPLAKFPADVDNLTTLLGAMSANMTPSGTFAPVGALPDPATASAAWWTLWTDLVDSPYATPALRATALHAAARQIESTGSRTDTRQDAPDITGRAGVSVGVVYLRQATIANATLTFAPDTGRLLQRAVTYPAGDATITEVTVFAR